MINLIIDTNMLYQANEAFNHPDFQKILRHSKHDQIKIYIPHIVWEERRTQLLEKLIASIRKIKSAHNEFLPAKGLLLQHIPQPILTVITEEEAQNLSFSIMEDFAKENKIEITQLGNDHAVRAWNRYFQIRAPFNAEQARVDRRKDIPDSWILEAAIDLKANHQEVVVLIQDGKLKNALLDLGFVITESFEGTLDLIEKCLEPSIPIVNIETQVELATTPTNEPVSDLVGILQTSYKQFEGLDVKLLGYVASLNGATKSSIIDQMASLGVSSQTINNIADRLVMSGMIKDTGNHYLLVNKTAGELAAREVESEIIKMLEQDSD